MIEQITVAVPYEKTVRYTLFAQGVQSALPLIDSDGSFIRFSFLGRSVLVLFYTFHSFRRVFVVTRWNEKYAGTPIVLPGVDSKLLLLYEARGRQYDDFKRVLYLLTKDDPYRCLCFPLPFWFKLFALIEHYGGKKSDVIWLFEKYKNREKYVYEDVCK